MLEKTQIEAIYREHGAKIWRALLAYVGDPEMASDVTSEVFAQALRRGDRLEKPLSWIWASAFRIANGFLQVRGTEVAFPGEGSYEMSGSNVEIMQALKELSTKQRAALILFYYVDQPVREIAKTIGSSAAAVRVHLSQGRKRMRELMGVQHD